MTIHQYASSKMILQVVITLYSACSKRFFSARISLCSSCDSASIVLFWVLRVSTCWWQLFNAWWNSMHSSLAQRSVFAWRSKFVSTASLQDFSFLIASPLSLSCILVVPSCSMEACRSWLVPLCWKEEKSFVRNNKIQVEQPFSIQFA